MMGHGFGGDGDLIDYANSRASFTPQQRERLRALLVFGAYCHTTETAYPYRVSMGGHPNFIINDKKGLATAPAVFPKHPDAEFWRDEYVAFYETWLKDYIRPGRPDLALREGRFMEGPCNYMPVSMYYIYRCAKLLHQYDGTYLLEHPLFRQWVDWAQRIIVLPPLHNAPLKQVVMSVPTGAHADTNRWLVDGSSWKEPHNRRLQEMCIFMKQHGNDPLADTFLWMLTAGQQGAQPNLTSSVFADNGVFMRYDLGGPNEAFCHLFQRGSTTGSGNYRWGYWMENGALYYAAKGKVWSWHGYEDNGDETDYRHVSYFHPPGRRGGLGQPASAEDYGILYDFGIAQYYQAAAGPGGFPGYESRGLMMLGGDYIAVHDDVANNDIEGVFGWENIYNGVVGKYYKSTDFTGEPVIRQDDNRFAVDFQWGDGSPIDGGRKDGFSVRWEGLFYCHADGKVTFELDITPKDAETTASHARLYLDGKLLVDADVEDARATLPVKAYRHYPLRIEYVHKTGEAMCRLGIDHPKDSFLNGVRGGYHTRRLWWRGTMPDIHSVPGKVNEPFRGDQLHVVAPASHPVRVEKRAWGALVNGEEHVLMSDEPINVREGELEFRGRTGFARPEQLVLFEGRRIALGGMRLEIEGGSFGASAKRERGAIAGHIAGSAGGALRLTPGRPFDPNRVRATVQGQPIPVRCEGGRILFDVDVCRADGVVDYRVSFRETGMYRAAGNVR